MKKKVIIIFLIIVVIVALLVSYFLFFKPADKTSKKQNKVVTKEETKVPDGLKLTDETLTIDNANIIYNATLTSETMDNIYVQSVEVNLQDEQGQKAGTLTIPVNMDIVSYGSVQIAVQEPTELTGSLAVTSYKFITK